VMVSALALPLTACQRRSVIIENRPAYLFASAADCHRTLVVGPLDSSNRTIYGANETIPVGTIVRLIDDDIDKQSVCYKVTFGRKIGFVLGMCLRVDIVGEPCGGAPGR